ncbi:hypothetical protein QR680_002538 [Steinernema hermaphroditum]|uniref:Uncharacterized protein n=1 Tax=Steinernema hermaphroditum TaxID=289476 RepID=A0AA39H331_9BILA|nr:hypothetical protein QR680_002538 [Steinernema hermaphroditum]
MAPSLTSSPTSLSTRGIRMPREEIKKLLKLDGDVIRRKTEIKKANLTHLKGTFITHPGAVRWHYSGQSCTSSGLYIAN